MMTEMTFGDQTAATLVKIKALVYAVDMLVQSSNIDPEDADKVANLVSVIEDEIIKANEYIEKGILVEKATEDA